MAHFELMRSETLLEGRAFKIRRDHLRTPDGHETKYEIVEHVGSVILLPLDDEGNLLFVRQYRHAAGSELLELPAGTREEDESYESCAARELREETGLAARVLEKAGEFYLAPGYSTEFMKAYIARDLTADPLPSDVDEFLQLERIPVERALRMAAEGQVPDAKSLAALFLAGPKLQLHR